MAAILPEQYEYFSHSNTYQKQLVNNVDGKKERKIDHDGQQGWSRKRDCATTWSLTEREYPKTENLGETLS